MIHKIPLDSKNLWSPIYPEISKLLEASCYAESCEDTEWWPSILAKHMNGINRFVLFNEKK